MVTLVSIPSILMTTGSTSRPSCHLHPQGLGDPVGDVESPDSRSRSGGQFHLTSTP